MHRFRDINYLKQSNPILATCNVNHSTVIQQASMNRLKTIQIIFFSHQTVPELFHNCNEYWREILFMKLPIPHTWMCFKRLLNQIQADDFYMCKTTRPPSENWLSRDDIQMQLKKLSRMRIINTRKHLI